MGANAIFINTKTKVAADTSYRMSTIEQNCLQIGRNLFSPTDSFFVSIEKKHIYTKDFPLEKENLLIVSEIGRAHV